MKRSILIIILAVTVLSGVAQKINIGYIYPAGVQRGSSSIIYIGGQNIASAKEILISGKGITAEVLPPDEVKNNKTKRRKSISDEDNLQLAQKAKVRITVDKGAEPGIRDLKVVNKNGDISNRLFFEVGQFADYCETEPNNSFGSANFIEKLPATINGYVEKSSVNGAIQHNGGADISEHGGKDFFSFNAKKGETIVVQVTARRFVPYLADAVPGWFQPTITLYNEDGNETAYCDDYMLNADPVIIYKIPNSGKYTLKINDAIYRGREDFTYRINIGSIPFVTSVFPLGGNPGDKISIQGVNLNTKTIKIPHSGFNKQQICYTNKKGISSNLFPVFISNDKEVMGSCTELKEGIVINARITSENETHTYKVNVKKNENWLFKLTGRRLGSPIDAKMNIYDSRGELIMSVDDTEDKSEGLLTHQADPECIIKFKESGDYFIKISETQSKFGENYSYRLEGAKNPGDFTLNLSPSSISIPQGGVAIFNVHAIRSGSLKKDIKINIEGLPEGYVVSDCNIHKTVKTKRIAIQAPENADLGKLSFSIIGEMTDNEGNLIKKTATPVEEMEQAFYISHLIKSDEFQASITPALPFTIELVIPDNITLGNENKTAIEVIVNRKDGFNEPIQILNKTMPKTINFSSITIDGDKSKGIIYLEIDDKKDIPKTIDLMVQGTVKASTVNRVAGQARNTVMASIMVLSPIYRINTTNTANKKKRKKP